MRRKTALRRHLAELEKAFSEAAAAASEPGQGRTWMYAPLSACLRIYRKLEKQKVEGHPLLHEAGKTPRAVFKRMVRRFRRDDKTTDRWVSALVNAHQSEIKPDELPAWLKAGGGISGRARQIAKSRTKYLSVGAKSPDSTTNGVASEAAPASPQATAVSPEAIKPIA